MAQEYKWKSSHRCIAINNDVVIKKSTASIYLNFISGKRLTWNNSIIEIQEQWRFRCSQTMMEKPETKNGEMDTIKWPFL